MVKRYTNLSEKKRTILTRMHCNLTIWLRRGARLYGGRKKRETIITGRWGESMIRGFCWGMFFAAILAHFLHADTMLINLAQPYVPHIALTSAYYYLAFGVVGIFFRLFKG